MTERVERDRMRGTGGNLIIPSDASINDLLVSVNEQLLHLRRYAEEDGRRLDLAEVTISTLRTRSGQISVSVTADLVHHTLPAESKPDPKEMSE